MEVPMNNITITIKTDAALLNCHLHFPNEMQPAIGLSMTSPNDFKDLPDGLYSVSLSGTGQTPDLPVEIAVEGQHNARSRFRQITERGTIASLVDFFLEAGDVQ